MGAMVTLQLVKTSDQDQLLATLAGFYAAYGIELMEEDMPQASGLLPKGKTHFTNIREYIEDLDRIAKGDILFTTNFCLFKVIDTTNELSNYIGIYYFFPVGKHSLYANPELSEVLSKFLDTTVIDYLLYGAVDWIELRKYEKGILIDELITAEGEINSQVGVFKEIKESEDGFNFDDFIQEYFKKMNINGIDLEYIYLSDGKYEVTPLFLKGNPDEILKHMT